MKTLKLLPVFVSLAFATMGNAAVEWARKEITAEAVIGAPKVAFSFAFTNQGKSPVVFEAPTASCGCTLAKWEKSVYAPGESGELKGTYSTSGRHGLNTVTIAIKGNEIDGEAQRPFADTLKLSVNVPEAVRITPGIALWRKGAEANAKTIRFEVNKSLSLPLTLTQGADAGFATEWLEIEAGRLYELVAAPTSTAEARQTRITVEGANSDGQTLHFHAHLLIR